MPEVVGSQSPIPPQYSPNELLGESRVKAQPEFEEPRHTLANSKRKNKENPGRASPILSQNIDTRIWKILLTFLCETPIV
jgi:hypothetical protein